MKQKLSVTIDEDILRKLETRIDGKLFRNKSHVVEFALAEWLENEVK